MCNYLKRYNYLRNILEMFQGMKVATKKSSKKDSSKKPNRGKASLEETRGSELTQSFSDKFDNLGIDGSITYENSNTSECI
ncbi:hypothetical protein F8M41_015851 [Gigaspora margarita]|uniref:Uncharacterized protein n=1 Tax=Gigaspora margarita TaxID=4874 RepID=A0A8H4AQB9_GIGMA|nr:hypothetical protein F8M41_015851 [Gigaspora margarita]